MNIGVDWSGHECIRKSLIFKLISHPKLMLMSRKMLCALDGIHEGHDFHTITPSLC